MLEETTPVETAMKNRWWKFGSSKTKLVGLTVAAAVVVMAVLSAKPHATEIEPQES